MNITSEKLDKALVVRVQDSALSLGHMEKCYDLLFEKPAHYAILVVDFSHLETLEDSAWPMLAKVGMEAEKLQAKLVLLTESKLAQMIKDRALDNLLPCFVGIKFVDLNLGALEKGKLTPQDYMNLAFDGVKNAIKTYAQADVQKGQTFVPDLEHHPTVDIAGVGVFSSDTQVGELILGFNLPSYLGLASAIMRKEFEALEGSIRDWPSELINTAMGYVKTTLGRNGVRIQLDKLSVLQGDEFEKVLPSKIQQTLHVLKCNSSFGDFVLELTLSDKNKSG